MIVRISRAAAFFLLFTFLTFPSALSESTSLSMMGLEQDGSDRVWENSQFFVRMQEQTGVSFAFQQYNDQGAYQTAKEAVFHDESPLPDVLFKADLSPYEEIAYLESGHLVDLAPYLEAYAPALFTILEKRTDWRDCITQPNGAIASLPVLNGSDRQCCIWINTEWLQALELEMPDTIEEYTEVLRAFRDRDPNGNGKNDEIPLSLVGPWEAKYLLHAWGLTPNDYNIFVDDAGKVRFAPFEPGFRDFVTWLNIAVSESLVDPIAFRQTQSTRANALSDTEAPPTIGGMVSIAPYTVVDMGITTSYAVLTPLEHNGARVYRRLLNGVGRGAFAITSACTDIEAALRWVDTLYTEEGGRLAFAGQEGIDFTLENDGSWKWISGENYTQLTEIAQNSIIAGDSRTPGLEPAAFMRNTEIVADNYARRQVDTIQAYLVDPFPITWPTDLARENRIAELQEALGVCVDTAIANFAMGITPLDDASWAAFLDELTALGAEEFLDLWQAKYDETL